MENRFAVVKRFNGVCGENNKDVILHTCDTKVEAETKIKSMGRAFPNGWAKLCHCARPQKYCDCTLVIYDALQFYYNTDDENELSAIALKMAPNYSVSWSDLQRW